MGFRRGGYLLPGSFAMAVVSACVSTNHVMVDPTAPRYAATTADSVVIYERESELQQFEYVRIALIDASASSDFSDRIDMIEAMRKQAAKLGANAILISGIEEPPALARVAATVLGAETERRGSVVALRILGRRQATESR